MNDHKCYKEFPTYKIDECTGIGSNFCEGTENMVLSVWFRAKDGTECYYDDWVEVKVNYCPFCGLKSKKE